MPKYVIAAGGNSNASGTWSNVSSASAGGDGVPTAADDVVLDAGSGNLTINAAMVCRSIDCNGYTGTLTHNSSVTVTIGDGTAGAGNIALRLVAGMTYTKGSNSTSAMAFVSTSATQQSIYCGGKALGNTTFNGAGGSWVFADSFKSDGSSTTKLTLTQGSLDTGNQTVDTGAFTFNGSSTRSLTLGSSAITTKVATGSGWAASATGLTFSAGTSSITCSNIVTFAGAGLAYGSVSFLTPNNAMAITGANTFVDLTYTGNSQINKTLSLDSNQIISGVLTITGNSLINRPLVLSNTKGTARTLTAASLVCTNVIEFQDITGAGAATWTTGASGATYFGDCGGNSGITFTTPATQTATGTASFTWSTHGWTSRVPLPQDDVVVNNAFVAGRTITMDMPRAGKSITFGCSGSPVFSTSLASTLFGSLDLTGVGSLSFGGAINFEGRGAFTVTSAGLTLQNAVNLTSPGGSLTCQDAFGSSSAFTLNNGEFNDNGYSVSATAFSSSSSNVRTLTMSGSWTLSGTGTVWSTSAHTNLTLNATGSTIVVSNATASAKTVNVGTIPTLTYGNLTVTGDNVSLSGAAVFNNLNVNTAGLTNGFKLPSGSSNTFADITTNGSAGNLAKLVASTGGSAATIVKSGGGTITTDYMSIQDITLSTTNSPVWYAGVNSTNVSGNTNITFTGPPGGAVYWVYIPRSGRIFNGSIV